MSSTNKTTNYDLSQYIGSDKPTYLSDYNGDMLKIDTAMKANADNVALAISGVETATTTANTANATATTASTNATSALGAAAQVASDLNAFEQKFNLSNTKVYNANSSDVSYPETLTLTNIQQFSITLAKNNDGSIFKLYGPIYAGCYGPGTCKIELNNTGILVDEPYQINCVGYCSWQGGNGVIRNVYANIENNKITIGWYNASSANIGLQLWPCIYFNANFGDESNS